MGIHLERFAELRPFLYHLTARLNLESIRESRRLEPAARILALAGREDLLRTRRRNAEIVYVEGRPVHIRDQAPLHAGHMEMTDGWAHEDFTQHLNARVFFWP